jgi:N-methylhydantoinase A
VTARYRVGVDIGGTFTDAVRIDESTGSIRIDKLSTTPDDPSRAFLQVVRRILAKDGASAADVAYVMHATTVATNAVLQRKGARAGLVVTHGFRDVLEIARQVRHELYNVQTEKPQPLIPRELCLEVPERLNYRGEVQVPLDEEAVRSAATKLREAGVESIAVCFLHSYRNPVHEQRAMELIHEVHPSAEVSISSAIAPEMREYWRASTTVINAYISPIVRRYLEAIERKLKAEGIASDLQLMQSNGGLMSAESAKNRPVFMLESGPAAGVAAAAYFAELMGRPDSVSFDMGGTTAKMGLILGYRPRVISEFEAGGKAGSGATKKGSGYPVLGSVLDLVEVGAGGGSIAWIDSGQVLRVGPQSSGADPGPACYMRGGKQATITDANLVLGRINPDYFLGGEIRLDVEASQMAIVETCARPLGMDPVKAAMGIIDIANATMVQAMRLVSVARGYDPRDFSLVATGGAGPLHSNQLAAELGIPTVIIPPSPGVASALGMLVSDLRHDYRVTNLQPLADLDLNSVNRVYREFEAAAVAQLAREGATNEAVELDGYFEIRYVGQSWKIRITTPARELRPQHLVQLKQAFDAEHEKSYGYCVPDEPAEVVNIGLSAVGRIPKAEFKEVDRGDTSPRAAFKASRPVYFAEAAGFVNTDTFDRYRLLVGNRVLGPAIVEEVDSTVLIHPRFEAEVARFGILLLRPIDARDGQ